MASSDAGQAASSDAGQAQVSALINVSLYTVKTEFAAALYFNPSRLEVNSFLPFLLLLQVRNALMLLLCFISPKSDPVFDWEFMP